MKRPPICLLAALAAAPALAQAVTVDEYYVVRDPDSQKCTIVEHIRAHFSISNEL